MFYRVVRMCKLWNASAPTDVLLKELELIEKAIVLAREDLQKEKLDK